MNPMNASRSLRLAVAASTLLLVLGATPLARADVYQDSFCKLTKNLDVSGRSALSAEVTKLAGAFAAMKSFFVAFAAADQQRQLASTLFAQGKTALDFVNKNYNTVLPPKERARTWTTLVSPVGTFERAFRTLYKPSVDNLAAAETKVAAALKKAATVSRWESVMKSQTHSADTPALTPTETAALDESVLPSSFATLFRSLLYVQYALQTWPTMLAALRTAATAICTKAKGMKVGGFVKTAAIEYADYLAQAAEDFVRLEAFLRKWAPELQSVATTIKALEASLTPVKATLDTLLTALAPLDRIQPALDSAMTETLCMRGYDLCLAVGEYPVKSKGWGPGSGIPGRSLIGIITQVGRRFSKVFDPVMASLPKGPPALTALNNAADKIGVALGTLNSFFTALETVIDITMDGEADALHAIIAELNAQKLAD